MNNANANLFKPLNDLEGSIRECIEIIKREREARLKAENANRQKDTILAVVAHELRNPLQSISGWLNLLRCGNLDQQNAEFAVEAIERGIKLQTKLIEDLFDAAQITSGKLRLNLREIEISPLISGVLNDLKILAEAKQIEIQAVSPPNLGRLTADAERLEQVLRNLLTNAIKFTPPSGKITVKTNRSKSGIEIEVCDTGRGIDASFLPHLFEPFTQFSRSDETNRNGLGLGLSIVRRIVELHGGNIVAESAGVEQGAIFKVQIPLNPTGALPELKRSQSFVGETKTLNQLYQ
ncbi:MAG TPA: HAMP domain-containing sensor histidine kinase [Pyrinomonadaceae bacterium]